MIEGIAPGSAEWKRVDEHVAKRIEKLKDKLVRTSDPVAFHRLQGAIMELEVLIEIPNIVEG